jgi:serine/threonine-protein kinase
MVEVDLDGNGKLLSFSGKPYDSPVRDAQPVPPEVVFHAAGFDLAAFQEIPPGVLPPYAADQVRAWKGMHPKIADMEMNVQIAWWKGTITSAKVIYPYQRGEAAPEGLPLVRRFSAYLIWVVLVAGIVFVTLLARRNWKLGRVDRRGAFRIAVARSILAIVAWLGAVHFVPSDDMMNVLGASSADWLFSGALLWLLYLALEPAVRARWPHSLVTWNRVLSGRWLDPQVGGHILTGAAVGCAMWVGIAILGLYLNRDSLSTAGSLSFTLGTRSWIGGHANALSTALRVSLMAFFAIFGLRTAVHKDWIAAILAALLFTFSEGDVTHSRDVATMVAVYVSLYSILIFVLLRFGLLSMIAAIYFLNCFSAITMGTDWRAWYVPFAVASMLLMLGIAVFAFWRSIGDTETLST